MNALQKMKQRENRATIKANTKVKFNFAWLNVRNVANKESLKDEKNQEVMYSFSYKENVKDKTIKITWKDTYIIAFPIWG